MIVDYGIPPDAKSISEKRIRDLANDLTRSYEDGITEFADRTGAFSYAFDNGVTIFEREQVINGKYTRKGFISKL